MNQVFRQLLYVQVHVLPVLLALFVLHVGMILSKLDLIVKLQDGVFLYLDFSRIIKEWQVLAQVLALNALLQVIVLLVLVGMLSMIITSVR